MTNPWDRRDAETNPAWLAFVAYRDLPPKDRSIAAALKASGKAPGQVRAWERWSSANDWQARAKAWDARLDARRQAAAEETVEAMAKRHAAQGRALQAKALAGLNRLTPEELDPKDVAALMRVGVGVETTARTPTVHRHEVSGPDGGPVPLRVEVVDVSAIPEEAG